MKLIDIKDCHEMKESLKNKTGFDPSHVNVPSHKISYIWCVPMTFEYINNSNTSMLTILLDQFLPGIQMISITHALPHPQSNKVLYLVGKRYNAALIQCTRHGKKTPIARVIAVTDTSLFIAGEGRKPLEICI